ncbi:hypothetical protein BF93_01415 [Brachybacterium phenoliresistens]|uniref:asparagine synthase (glutamine-hydrolyzing) n=1 Tax=Brachybacterium phenoliresistens TaxID=396014 RepID=Z9JR48_9MICO|nr:hypothetical protein BF93_01415 [Brachybacterium phenoliresistens]
MLTLATDHLRSWPLYYRIGQDAIHVADNAFDIADAVPDTPLDAACMQEFLHAGYVIGSDTLFAGVHQVPAGTTVTIDLRDGRVASRLERPLRLQPVPPPLESLDVFAERFSEGVDDAMARLIEAADGRTIALPLSAGLDSRLLATRLARSGYPHVLTYTYGLPGAAEAEASRRIAAALGLPWQKVELHPARMQEAWQSPETADFLRESSGGAALPHIQDWYAVRMLTRSGALAPASIVIPGHTVVSAARDAALRDVPNPTGEQILAAVTPWTFDLRSRPEAVSGNPKVRAALAEFLREAAVDGSRRSTMSAVRWFFHRERQVKYILNSVRAYEHFGLDWALPLHDLQLWDLYEQAPDAAIESRDWYRSLIERDHAEQLGLPAPATVSGSGAVSAPRAMLRRAMRVTGAAALHTRLRRISGVVDHPLGFDALLTGTSRTRLTAATLRGQTPIGMYAEQFLRDEWSRGARLFTTRPIHR